MKRSVSFGPLAFVCRRKARDGGDHFAGFPGKSLSTSQRDIPLASAMAQGPGNWCVRRHSSRAQAITRQ